MSLKAYARKRAFGRTPEPPPGPSPDRGRRFVVQKHQASRLRFRLEMRSALKSWALPGNPGQGKTTSHQSRDHPCAYIDFEGNIPKNQYSGGTVMVWDQGTFETLGKRAPASCISDFAEETSANGTSFRYGGEWLLIRTGADMKPVSRLDDTSLSGRTMAQIAGNGCELRPGKTDRSPNASGGDVGRVH
jgi:bifunctional non-homologous end joining protein LigD